MPIHAGALHYWQVDPASWRPALEAMVSAGFNMVETYVPWNVHELARGRFDFGHIDPRKNLPRFLDLVHELGLLAFVRPGPHINAELTYFGLPERIVYDARCQARSATGGPVHLLAPPKMFPVPSYASQHFLSEADGWYKALSEVLVPRLWPNGALVLLQVDNEATFYFRDGPYEQDYHPDALRDFGAFLRGRYGSLSKLRAVYGRAITRWASVSPPTRLTAETPTDLPPHLDWMAFHELSICNALSHWSRQLRLCGLTDIPFVHNMALGETLAPASLGATQKVVDLVGIDYHHLQRDHSAVRRRTLRLAGSSPLAFAPELGVGLPAWFPPRSNEDSLQMALCALAHGLRGFNLYMAVARDRWCGAPIAEDGSPRADLHSWSMLVRALHDTKFHTLERKVEVAILLPQEYARLSRASHSLGGLGPTLFEATIGRPTDACSQHPFGFAQPIQHAWWTQVMQYSRALDAAGVPYVYVDSEGDADRLQGLRLILTPTFEFIDAGRWARLHQCAASGTLVLIGPVMPQFDAFMRPSALTMPDGMRLLPSLEEDTVQRLVMGLATELRLATPCAAHPRSVWTALHEDGQGRQVLFVVQPQPQPIQALIELTGATRATDLLTREVFEGHAHLRLSLGPSSCRMLELAPLLAPGDAARGAAC